MSIAYTKYRHLTNQEFIAEIEPIIRKSPIIAELATRLMKNNYNDDCFNPISIEEVENHHIKCPVCDANLSLFVEDKSFTDDLVIELKAL